MEDLGGRTFGAEKRASVNEPACFHGNSRKASTPGKEPMQRSGGGERQQMGSQGCHPSGGFELCASGGRGDLV